MLIVRISLPISYTYQSYLLKIRINRKQHWI